MALPRDPRLRGCRAERHRFCGLSPVKSSDWLPRKSPQAIYTALNGINPAGGNHRSFHSVYHSQPGHSKFHVRAYLTSLSIFRRLKRQSSHSGRSEDIPDLSAENRRTIPPAVCGYAAWGTALYLSAVIAHKYQRAFFMPRAGTINDAQCRRMCLTRSRQR